MGHSVLTSVVGETLLKDYGKFLDNISSKLNDIKISFSAESSKDWQSLFSPIELKTNALEYASVPELVHSDNKLLKKVITAVATLCCEIDALRHEVENKIIPVFVFYDEKEDDENDDIVKEGIAQVQVSQILPVLQHVLCFIDRCREILCNCVRQVAALYDLNSQVLTVTQFHVQIIFEYMGDLLASVMHLNEVLANQNILKHHWSLYKQMTHSVKSNLERFGLTEETMSFLEKLVFQIDTRVFNCSLVESVVNQLWEGISQNVSFISEFHLTLMNMMTQIAQSVEVEYKHNPGLKVMGITGLFLLYYYITHKTDSQLAKQLWTLGKKYPAVHLVGCPVWCLDKFVILTFPTLDQADKNQQMLANSRSDLLQQHTQGLVSNLTDAQLQVQAWCLRMDAIHEHSPSQIKSKDLKIRIELYQQGVALGADLKNLVSIVMNLYVYMSTAMPRVVLIQLCRRIELIKYVVQTFKHHAHCINETTRCLIRQIQYKLIKLIEPVETRVVNDKKLKASRLDLLSALRLASGVIDGPGTPLRYLIARLALTFCTQTGTFQEDELGSVILFLRQLNFASSVWEKLSIATDCTAIYWHSVIVPVYGQDLYNSCDDLQRTRMLFEAFRDCFSILHEVKHCDSQLLINSWQDELYNHIKDIVLQPFCSNIETDLRLRVHSHLQLEDRNPFVVGLKDRSALLELSDLKIITSQSSVKQYVEHYLDRTFYNLTTVALHNWRTYEEMRDLAEHRHDLRTVESNLPSQTLEQGLDLLELMRNIHVFVSKYNYNLNNQLFVEKNSTDCKFLKTITVNHVANSIRTHGTGIMNTTVNFTYQYLKKKLYQFSQFLFDENIKSRLNRDSVLIAEARESSSDPDLRYPFNRAAKFSSSIRKLSHGDDLSYLDRFRILITDIGNAMGFVRMIRSGGLHYSSQAMHFVSDVSDLSELTNLLTNVGFSDTTLEASRQANNVVCDMSRNCDESTRYIKLLVDVFEPLRRGGKEHSHLKNFHLIIPPLTINFIEYIVSAKDQLNKRSSSHRAFTDDGFAMGIAYLLKILDLQHSFDSLHWFESIDEHFENEMTKASEQKRNKKIDEKLLQTITLTQKRLELNWKEFRLLYYNLSSARLFFRDEKRSENGSELSNKSETDNASSTTESGK